MLGFVCRTFLFRNTSYGCARRRVGCCVCFVFASVDAFIRRCVYSRPITSFPFVYTSLGWERSYFVVYVFIRGLLFLFMCLSRPSLGAVKWSLRLVDAP